MRGDVEALRIFSRRCNKAQISTLPGLHAKVYVFDRELAIVSSANLTSGGLDANYEYGIGTRDPSFVNRILEDLDSYARLGSVVPLGVLDELAGVAAEATEAYERILRSAAADARKRFEACLAKAKAEFSRALVGTRSARAFFRDAILVVLRNGPLPTEHLHPLIQRMLPDLCDDKVDLVINGQHFGKAWKHHVRNAQQDLKKAGQIQFDGRLWGLHSA